MSAAKAGEDDAETDEQSTYKFDGIITKTDDVGGGETGGVGWGGAMHVRCRLALLHEFGGFRPDRATTYF